MGKVAFERLKRKDLSYFEVDDEDLSEEAVQLGFLEHVQVTTSSGANQFGFRHLTVQEYLAALYASTEVLKKAEDVADLAERLGCGVKSGHLNTFWVFVAGLLESRLCEELFCAIAETDTQTVAGSLRQSESLVDLSGATNAQQEVNKHAKSEDAVIVREAGHVEHPHQTPTKPLGGVSIPSVASLLQ